MFLFYSDSYKVPCPVKLLDMDEVDLLIYTKDPDLEEKKENRKRRELYWGLHRDELWHRHSYNVKFQVSSCDFDRLL